MSKDINRLLTFWFGSINPAEMATHREEWWVKNPEFDKTIKEEFEPLYEQAAIGELDHWKSTPMGSVALVLLLDQVPRNIYRNSKRAFATDKKALSVTRNALNMGFHQLLPLGMQLFLYMPLEHSEERDDQNASVKLIEALGDDGYIDFAIKHQVIIERFGRFPHRNEILGRDSTEEEIEFLKLPTSRF